MNRLAIYSHPGSLSDHLAANRLFSKLAVLGRCLGRLLSTGKLSGKMLLRTIALHKNLITLSCREYVDITPTEYALFTTLNYYANVT